MFFWEWSCGCANWLWCVALSSFCPDWVSARMRRALCNYQRNDELKQSEKWPPHEVGTTAPRDRHAVRRHWRFKELSVFIEDQQYTLQIFNPSINGHGGPFMLMKYPIHAIYLKQQGDVQYTFYDDNDRCFVRCFLNILSRLELEAAFHAYAQIGNALFTSCYLPHFSKDKGVNYYIRFAKCPAPHDHEGIIMDRICMQRSTSSSIMRQRIKSALDVLGNMSCSCCLIN